MAFPIFKKAGDIFDYQAIRICKNCENTFSGKFCNRCGEVVVDTTDRSFAKMAESLLNAFTFLEGKFWRSFKLLLLQPGKLSDQIRSGVQVPYMKLVGLFFVANFFYFLFPVFDTYNSSLSSQYNYQGYSELVQSVVKNYLQTNHIPIEKFTNQYNAQSGNLAKLLLVILVFFYSMPLSLINYSKKNLYFDHLQFSFEFHSFQILIVAVIVPNVLTQLIRLASFNGLDWSILLGDDFSSIISLSLFFYFFIRAQRAYYKNSWIVSGIKAAFLAWLVIYSWKVYRFVLFFITMWTL